MKHLPLILVSTGGAVLLGTYLYNRHKGTIPANPLQAKVSNTIATSNDPSMLKQLASGLQKTGDLTSATAALQKASNLTGVPISVPGLPPVTPGGNVPVVAATGAKSPTQYRVVSGDIPGAIAKRFGVSLSVLAKANGTNSNRIMGGKINVGEVLKLPAGVTDSGPASRAKGIAT